mmetsp:Transcript_715/g.1295  ORF Transcript_715/g.1295 Transcript_715/m.1295 type:complete len:331 (+) Transcript_715:205-1197(+)
MTQGWAALVWGQTYRAVCTENAVIARQESVSWNVGEALQAQGLLGRRPQGAGHNVTETIKVANMDSSMVRCKAPVGGVARRSPTPNLHSPASSGDGLCQVDEVGTCRACCLALYVAISGAEHQHMPAALPLPVHVLDVHQGFCDQPCVHELLPVRLGISELHQDLEASLLPMPPDSVACWRPGAHHHLPMDLAHACHHLRKPVDVDPLRKITGATWQELAADGDVAVVHKDVCHLLPLRPELLLCTSLQRWMLQEGDQVFLHGRPGLVDDGRVPRHLYDSTLLDPGQAVLDANLHPQVSAEHTTNLALGPDEPCDQVLRNGDPLSELLAE